MRSLRLTLTLISTMLTGCTTLHIAPPQSISDSGLALIKAHEGYRSEAYLDAVGVWTIGWGHTRTAREGMIITEEKATSMLVGDLAHAEAAVRRSTKVVLSQCQYDALVSLVFNIGAKAYHHSTLLRKLNAGDYRGASEQFTRWVYGKKRILRGLVKRRKHEQTMFNTCASDV